MPTANLRVRLSPRSARSEIVRHEEGVLHIRVTAPSVEGAANAALISLLADILGVRKGAVGIVSGASSREKKVTIDGIDADELQIRIGRALGEKLR